ncbi:MAG: zinc-ribbon domain-containing protein [Kiritimatiellia bacterium]
MADKTPDFRTIVAAYIVFSICAVSALAQIVICPKCGYENTAGAETCRHCGAELPGAGSSGGGRDAEAGVRPSRAFLDVEVVEREARSGVKHLNSGDVYMARLLLRNATALNMLTPAGAGEDVAGVMLKKLRESEIKAGLLGKESRLSGSMLGRVRENMARAAKRFTMLQRSKKFVPVGGAWIPSNIERDLSTRQAVLLKRSIADFCFACGGVGRVKCPTCGGRGTVKCPNPECREGTVRVAVQGQLTKSKLINTRKCPVCNGTGTVSCEECNGIGTILCAKCRGTGERPLCDKCGGQGYLKCPKCSGTGVEDGEVCEECGGEGIVVCTSCNGDGRE